MKIVLSLILECWPIYNNKVGYLIVQVDKSGAILFKHPLIIIYGCLICNNF